MRKTLEAREGWGGRDLVSWWSSKWFQGLIGMEEELIVLGVQKEICFQRSWRFPRRGKGGDTSLWKEGKASHGKLKNLYLMSYFSASDSVGRREAWAGILGICTGVLFHLFPVLPNSSHASVLPTMSAMEVCYWTKQFSWTDETSLDWKDMDDALHCEQFQNSL